jgi:hypothetical protein
LVLAIKGLESIRVYNFISSFEITAYRLKGTKLALQNPA